MKPSEIELDVWYVDALGRRLRAIDRDGPRIRYEDGRGNVGDMDAETFARRCVTRAARD